MVDSECVWVAWGYLSASFLDVMFFFPHILSPLLRTPTPIPSVFHLEFALLLEGSCLNGEPS